MARREGTAVARSQAQTQGGCGKGLRPPMAAAAAACPGTLRGALSGSPCCCCCCCCCSLSTAATMAEAHGWGSAGSNTEAGAACPFAIAVDVGLAALDAGSLLSLLT